MAIPESFRIVSDCHTCGGTGQVSRALAVGSELVDCGHCRATGKVEIYGDIVGLSEALNDILSRCNDIYEDMKKKD